MNSPPPEDKPSYVEDFFPGYFALVMATGIVSLAMNFEGFPGLPEVLLWLNVIFYVILWGITVLRIIWFRSALIADLIHHARGVTFLTAVAGTGVLGVQFAILTPFMAVAAGLWVFAVLLWIVLIYTFFAAVTIAEPKPSPDEDAGVAERSDRRDGHVFRHDRLSTDAAKQDRYDVGAAHANQGIPQQRHLP